MAEGNVTAFFIGKDGDEIDITKHVSNIVVFPAQVDDGEGKTTNIKFDTSNEAFRYSDFEVTGRLTNKTSHIFFGTPKRKRSKRKHK